MKIITTILIILFTLSCNSEQECDYMMTRQMETIIFIFAQIFFQTLKPIILESHFASQYASGKVSKEEYDQYAVGDEYCF